MKYVPSCIYALTSCLMMYKGMEGGVWISLFAVAFLLWVRDDVIIVDKDDKNESETD